MNDRSLTDITNRRLLNLKEKTLGYRFTVVHVPGRKNLGPDAASRHPTGVPERLQLPEETSNADTADTPISCRDALPGQRAEDIDIADDISTVSAATCALNAVVSVVTWDIHSKIQRFIQRFKDSRFNDSKFILHSIQKHIGL